MTTEETLEEYRKQFAEDQARINALTAQVATLTAALERAVRLAEACPVQVMSQAEAFKRQQRLIGARELTTRLAASHGNCKHGLGSCVAPQPETLLTDMEREESA